LDTLAVLALLRRSASDARVATADLSRTNRDTSTVAALLSSTASNALSASLSVLEVNTLALEARLCRRADVARLAAVGRGFRGNAGSANADLSSQTLSAAEVAVSRVAKTHADVVKAERARGAGLLARTTRTGIVDGLAGASNANLSAGALVATALACPGGLFGAVATNAVFALLAWLARLSAAGAVGSGDTFSRETDGAARAVFTLWCTAVGVDDGDATASRANVSVRTFATSA